MKGSGGSSTPFFRGLSGTRIMSASVFFSETVKPKAENTSTTMVVMRDSPAGDLETNPASSAQSIPQIACRTRSRGWSPPLFPGRLLSQVDEVFEYGGVSAD